MKNNFFIFQCIFYFHNVCFIQFLKTEKQFQFRECLHFQLTEIYSPKNNRWVLNPIALCLMFCKENFFMICDSIVKREKSESFFFHSEDIFFSEDILYGIRKMMADLLPMERPWVEQEKVKKNQFSKLQL